MAAYRINGLPYLVSGKGKKWRLYHDGSLERVNETVYTTRRDAVIAAGKLKEEEMPPQFMDEVQVPGYGLVEVSTVMLPDRSGWETCIFFSVDNGITEDSRVVESYFKGLAASYVEECHMAWVNHPGGIANVLPSLVDVF